MTSKQFRLLGRPERGKAEAMDWVHGLLMLGALVQIAGLVLIARITGQSTEALKKIAEIADRNERISAKVLTMLAGIEEHDQ